MALFKLKKNISRIGADNQKENEKDHRNKNLSKVETFCMPLTCFTTHCLSCIAVETGIRSPYGNPVTKSAVFNTLFRRTYNLKIIIFVTNVITGLITTLMMTLGDRYGIPYLYLPWLINTMKGIALCEGPTLLNLARMLLPNVTFPTAIFVVITLLVYVPRLLLVNKIVY
ncbi:unnamed protein product [Xylocopa violacea]|uniref:DUF2798 domain-containing protein n=1 Tax=Xylocopa violacea TaxID=135666 RepID=A0ABP1N5N1_XYLVO